MMLSIDVSGMCCSNANEVFFIDREGMRSKCLKRSARAGRIHHIPTAKGVTMENLKADELVANKDEAVEDLLGFSPIELQEASDSNSANEAASCLSCS